MSEENKAQQISLSVIDTVEVLPKKFYQNNDVLENLKQVTKSVSTEVYQLTDVDKKRSKSDVANVRKLAKNLKNHVKSTFEHESKAPILWRDLIISNIDKLLEEVKKIPAQFEEMERKKLAEIRELLIITLAHAWNDSGVRNQYQADLSCLEKAVMLTSLTPKGILTKRAKDYVNNVCEQNFKQQSLIDSRITALKLKCFESGIDGTALTREYIGDAFYGEDADFEARVDELLAIEVDKKEREAERVEAAKEKAVSDALAKQQDEADRKAKEKADAELLESQKKVTEETVIPPVVREKMDANREQAELNPPELPPAVTVQTTEPQEVNSELRTVTVTVKFEFNEVPVLTSNNGVQSMVMRSLTEKQRQNFQSIESH